MDRQKLKLAPTASRSTKIEAVLKKIAILALLLLIVSTTADWQNDVEVFYGFNHWLQRRENRGTALNWDRSHRAAFLSPPAEDVLTVSILLVNQPTAPEAHLVINGVPGTNFTDPHLTVEVRPGDQLVLDGTAAQGPLSFHIVDTSPGLNSPRQGTEIAVAGNQVPLDRVTAR